MIRWEDLVGYPVGRPAYGVKHGFGPQRAGRVPDVVQRPVGRVLSVVVVVVGEVGFSALDTEIAASQVRAAVLVTVREQLGQAAAVLR